jgi:two-component system sensor histidine kinase YesM
MSNIGTMIDHSLNSVYKQVEAVTQSRLFHHLHYSLFDSKTQFTAYDCIDLSNTIQNFYTQNSSVIDSTLLYLNDNSIMFYYGNNAIKTVHFDSQALNSLYPNGLLTWQGPHDKAVYDPIYPRDHELNLIMVLGDADSLKQGYFVTGIDVAYLNRILASQRLANDSYIFLSYGDTYLGSVELPDTYMLSAQDFSDLSQAPVDESHGFVIQQAYDHYVFYKPLGIPGLALISILPKDETRMQAANLYFLMGVFLGVVLIVGIAMNLIYNKTFAQPILRLTGKMKDAGEGNLQTVFDIQGISEINTINDNVQSLLKRLVLLIEQVHREQDQKRIAEIKALQSQINPHFLYNTLFSIRQLCSLHENEKAKSMIDSLATFYRIGVNKGKQVISLREELDHVKSYLDIQLMSLENQFQYDIDVDESLMDVEIPKLTLQPLVENALQHGIIPNRMPGNLFITAEERFGDLDIYVSDDGLGMSEELCSQILNEMASEQIQSKSTVYGMRNVHQRLSLTFGPKYGLSITSSLQQGTTVIVKIPIQYKEAISRTSADSLEM